MTTGDMLLTYAIGFVMVGISVLICSAIGNDAGLTSIGILLIFVGLIPAAILWLKKSTEQEALREQEEALRKQERQDTALAFYEACRRRKVDEEAEPGDLILIARSLGINSESSESLDKLFVQGKEVAERKKAEAAREQLEALRKDESREAASVQEKAGITKHRKYIGKELAKRSLAEFTIAAAPILKRSARLDMDAQANTTDWAIAGGIAQGIAGPAAGLAAAMQAQSDNAAAELEAQRTREEGHQRLHHAISAEREAKRTLASNSSFIECFMSKLCVDLTRNEFDEHLNFDGLECKLSEGRNVVVSGRVTTMPMSLVGNNAIIDGSIDVTVEDSQGRVVARGIYCAPGFDKSFLMTSQVGFGAVERFEALCISDRPLDTADGLVCKVSPRSVWSIEGD